MDEIGSLSDFRAAVSALAQDAVSRRARRLLCVDASFDDWPLDAPALIEALTAFVRLPERRLVLLASSYDGVPRAHPRFVAWRRNYGHTVQAWSPVDAGVEVPCAMLLDRSCGWQLLDKLRWRGRWLREPGPAALLGDQIDVFLQRCEPAFAASTLGL